MPGISATFWGFRGYILLNTVPVKLVERFLWRIQHGVKYEVFTLSNASSNMQKDLILSKQVFEVADLKTGVA